MYERENYEIIKLREQDEFIKLGQAVKAAVVESGSRGQRSDTAGPGVCKRRSRTRRGRKLYAGDVAEYNGEQIKIEK